MTDQTKAASWRLLGGIQSLAGHGYGSRYPSLVLSIEGLPLDTGIREALWSALAEVCPSMARPPFVEVVSRAWPQSLEWLLAIWQSLQLGSGLPVYEAGRVLVHSSTQARCLIPVSGTAHRAMAEVVQATLDWLTGVSLAGNHDSNRSRLEHAIKALSRHCPQGSNVPRFVKAAYEAGIPVLELPGGVYQYGVGSRARWLDSSFTDVTSTISSKLARRKTWASALLRQAGLPVPAHFPVADAQQAVQAAHRLGYPVVVKPADLDGGLGVAAGLLADEEVVQSYEIARKCSGNILVEKHAEGRDYRVTVFNGEVIAAIERVPAGVTGDGCSTVIQLIEGINADPRRGQGKQALLQRLVIDEESRRVLDSQRLSPSSVPANGRFVRLRRAANVASGGMPVAVQDRIHPDNARLAVRAAEALRLDLAGIDLLIPDIAVSWRQSGAAICEVNGQPNLGQITTAHVYGAILKQLVSGRGRIPTIVVVGADRSDPWLSGLSSRLTEAGMRVGVVGGGVTRATGETLHTEGLSPYAGGRMLALDRRVDAMILAIEDDSVLRTGLPLDRFDALILAGSCLRAHKPHAAANLQRLLNEVLLCVLPACDGVVVVPAGQGLKGQGSSARTRAVWHELDGDVHAVIEQTVKLLQGLPLWSEDRQEQRVSR